MQTTVATMDERIGRSGVIAVVVIDDAARAADLGDALVAGGIEAIEVTLRTPFALDAIRALADRPGLIVGAGTVLDVDMVGAAVDAGARFIVSPGFDEEVVAASHARGIPIIPGVATATEIQAARRAGCHVLKVFPAGPLGGPGMLRALAAPFSGVRFVPTGGITLADVGDYVALPSVHAIGGTFVAPPAILAAGDWAAITALARDAVSAAQAGRP
jgi:2-dehydro-3-deoxyphosphogluconate aldolase/(4S)-4-hydroxy-2-oxoglutarate aldolase